MACLVVSHSGGPAAARAEAPGLFGGCASRRFSSAATRSSRAMQAAAWAGTTARSSATVRGTCAFGLAGRGAAGPGRGPSRSCRGCAAGPGTVRTRQPWLTGRRGRRTGLQRAGQVPDDLGQPTSNSLQGAHGSLTLRAKHTSRSAPTPTSAMGSGHPADAARLAEDAAKEEMPHGFHTEVCSSPWKAAQIYLPTRLSHQAGCPAERTGAAANTTSAVCEKPGPRGVAPATGRELVGSADGHREFRKAELVRPLALALPTVDQIGGLGDAGGLSGCARSGQLDRQRVDRPGPRRARPRVGSRFGRECYCMATWQDAMRVHPKRTRRELTDALPR